MLNLNPTICAEIAKSRLGVVVSENLMNEFGKKVDELDATSLTELQCLISDVCKLSRNSIRINYSMI